MDTFKTQLKSGIIEDVPKDAKCSRAINNLAMKDVYWKRLE